MFNSAIFYNANDAFENLYRGISSSGIVSKVGTKKLNNVGFYIKHPLDNIITSSARKWNKQYADREWAWYLSENRSVSELKKYAPIWDKMHGGDNIVNSNYGYLWNENNQLERCISQLSENNFTRQATISIYDGKRKNEYTYDTPCTLAISFIIEDNGLNMSVLMRSNDVWFGFCNDQYCFSKLQEYVAIRLNVKIGWYYHYAMDMHIYNNFLDRKI